MSRPNVLTINDCTRERFVDVGSEKYFDGSPCDYVQIGSVKLLLHPGLMAELHRQLDLLLEDESWEPEV